MNDDYWETERSHYTTIELYVDLAVEQKLDDLNKLQQRDAVRYGVTVEKGHRHFDRFLALAKSVLEGQDLGTVEAIALAPDPWRSPGSWEITVCGSRGWATYVHDDKVRAALG